MSTSVILHGIPNCDTVRKARAWLTGQGIPFEFHDFKKQGVPADRLERWVAQLGWEKLLNRQGMTWRKIDPAVQAQVKDAASAKALMRAQPSIIRRPVVDWGGQTTVGFDEAAWAALPRRD